jgi:UDP-N-acetylglucosamine 2-epimerase
MVDSSANMPAGTKPEKILAAAELMMERNRRWINPFGKGDVARHILEVCKNKGTL